MSLLLELAEQPEGAFTIAAVLREARQSDMAGDQRIR